MFRDHRPLPACQKQHRQNDPAGQVAGVLVMGDPGHVYGPQTCPVKNNTDRMNQLVR